MYHFIVNPIASSGQGEIVWNKVKEILNEKNISYEYSLTSKNRTAKEIANNITANLQEDLNIVILGGDGTLNQVINGVNNFEKVILSIIPVGSGNDFIRSFKNTTTLENYINRIINPTKVFKYNIGKIENSFSTEKFIVSSGIGFDATITNEVNKEKFRRHFKIKLFHKFSYVFAMFKALTNYKPLTMNITVDEKNKTVENVYCCIIMNTSYEGKGVEFCPAAIGYDDILDICIIRSKSVVRLLPILLRAYKGKHITSKNVYTSKGKDFKIKASSSTHCHADGEQVGKSDWANFKISDKKIRVIVE